jgi:ATP-dependent helicase/nuclease subunit B
VRPTRFSVTEIESWLRDPYTIYAKRILRILPLDEVDTEPGARDRGTVIHESLAEFTKNTTAGLPRAALDELLAAGNAQFAALEDYPEARAFWWPRFQRIARWFIEGFESGRRPRIAALHAETDGNLEFQVGERSFHLRGRADRIERLTDGRYAILDYKTGQPPGQGEVRVGFAPQLPLEGAILRHGMFEGIDTGGERPSIAQYVYVSIRGSNPPGDQIDVDLKDTTADELADETLAKLKAYARKFESETQGYVSLLLTMWRTRYGDYDHLARVKEWSATAGPDEEPFA